MALSIQTQIECVRREIAIREHVYPKWIENGRMKQAVADHEIEAMKSVLDTLENVLLLAIPERKK